MQEPNSYKIYSSLEVEETYLEYILNYVYKETGLTPFNIYNETDFQRWRETALEILPEELIGFFNLLSELQTIEEDRLIEQRIEENLSNCVEEYGEDFLDFLEDHIKKREEENGEE